MKFQCKEEKNIGKLIFVYGLIVIIKQLSRKERKKSEGRSVIARSIRISPSKHFF